MKRLLSASFLAALLAAGSASADTPDTETIYLEHCAGCHGGDRLGGMGPALLPENLGRLRKKAAHDLIANGRPATQMPVYGDKLTAAQIDALVALIYTPLPEIPGWGLEEINDSHIQHVDPATLPKAPLHKADPMNLFVVVEGGDHHVTIMDGDRFEPLARFPSPFALHGGAKFSPDGRFTYLASRDGWVIKYDLHSLQVVAEIRAGINTRNIAVSGDGRFVAVANYLPQNLVMLDATDLKPIKIIPIKSLQGKSSRVSAVYTAYPRNSFVVALKDVPEMWEVSYEDEPPARFAGFVHSFEEGHEESLTADRFPVRRIELTGPLEDFFFDQPYRHVFGASRDGTQAVVVHMDVGREIAKVPLPGMPHLGSGITFDYKGRRVLATPHLKEGKVSVIDMKSWKVVKVIDTQGPGFFMRSHENSHYAWVDVFFGPNKDAVHIIDKRTLEIVKTLRPAPGKTAAHIEFTKDGRYALLSIWDMDGAVIVYDMETLEEVKRIPFVKPVGKYNVWNKITRSEGTSH
ncbi:MAG: c-type cytochrome [Alphaproteobacteria bacterium]|nr:c-type cytochrome [Alphaproteobacteria bacterium]